MLDEDHTKKLAEYDADQDKEIKKLESEIRDLKAKLARVLPQEYEQPDNDTDIYDEILPEQYKDWNDLVPGSSEAYDKGCKCPILDNQDMPRYKKWVSADCPLHGKAE
jgi:hypothetical protein